MTEPVTNTSPPPAPNGEWDAVRATLAGGDQTRAQALQSYESPDQLFEKLTAQPPEFDWRKNIAGDNVDELKKLERFPDLQTFHKAFNDTQKALHESGRVRVPGEGAPPEQVAEFAKAFGVAEKPDAYEIKATPPNGYEVSDGDKTILSELQTTLHEAMSKGAKAPDIMNIAHQFYLNKAAEANEAAMTRAEDAAVESEAQLKDLWKGQYGDNVKWAVAGMRQFFTPSSPDKGAEEFEDFLNIGLDSGHRLGDHPMILRMFATVGRQFAEDPFFQKMKGENQGFDPAKRKAEIMALRDTNPKAYASKETQDELDRINAGLARQQGQGRGA